MYGRPFPSPSYMVILHSTQTERTYEVCEVGSDAVRFHHPKVSRQSIRPDSGGLGVRPKQPDGKVGEVGRGGYGAVCQEREWGVGVRVPLLLTPKDLTFPRYKVILQSHTKRRK